VEEEVIRVMSRVDSLEVENDILVNVGGKRLGSPDLVICGCVEVEDFSASGYNLVIGEEVNRGQDRP
jgi:hypothetical protein